MTSSRPYLLRAMYDWIVDNKLTPYVAVNAEMPDVRVPEKSVRDGQIILNISVSATQKLLMSNDGIEFDARFSGVLWHIYVPINAVLAIYAQENGRGMVFEDDDVNDNKNNEPPTNPEPPKKPSKKPHLKIVK